MDVKLPDGTILKNVPEGTTKAQIAEKLGRMPIQGNAADAGNAAAYGIAGGQVPFGNTITSGLGAVGAKAYDVLSGEGVTQGQSVADLYRQAQADTAATQEAHPVATAVGNAAGIVSTLPLFLGKAAAVPGANALRTGLNAAPSVAAKVGNFVGRGEIAAAPTANLATKAAVGTANTILRGLKGAVVAAPTGFAYGAGDAPDGQRMAGGIEGATDAALIAGGASAGLPVLGGALGYGAQGAKNIYKGFKARDVQDLEQAGEIIKGRSSAAYKAMRDNGATFNPAASDKITSDIVSRVKSDGPLNQGLHGKTMSVLNDLAEASKSPDFDLEQLDQWRRLLGQVASNVTPDNLQDARKASLAIDALDDVVDMVSAKDLIKGDTSAIEALQLGRQEYARARKFQSISDIVKKSDGDANYLKRELKKFADNPKKTRGFTASEVSALQNAGRLSNGEAVLKMLGKFGFDVGNSRIGSGVGALVGAGTIGAGFGTGAGIAAPVAGTAARYGQKLIARGKAEDLLKIIENGGKVTQQQINALPPKEGTAFMKLVKQMPSALAKSSIIFDKESK